MGMKKLKKVAMIAAASMFVMMVPMIQTHAAPTDVIENNESGIPDKTLYQNILKVLGKQSTDTFTEQEASSVEELEIVDYKKIPMESLKGIGYLTNLETLRIKDQRQLSSLEGLDGRLTKLDALEVSYSGITSIKEVANLPSLVYLTFDGDKIRSLDGIQGLKNLRYLMVYDNCLTSLKGIEGAVNLEEFYAYGNQLTSLKGIENLTKLKKLEVGKNRLKNLKGIEKLTNLEELGVSENRLTDIKEIKNLKKLERIYAFCNKIKTLPNLKQFSELSYVFTDFSDNLLSEKELAAKLPKRFLTGGKNKKAWLADQKEFQKLKRTIKLANPKKKNEISVKTKEISGYAFPEAYVELKNLKTGKTTKCVKADKNGYFKLKKLNLKKWGGAKVQVNLYKYSKEQKRNVQVICNTVLKVKKK